MPEIAGQGRRSRQGEVLVLRRFFAGSDPAPGSVNPGSKSAGFDRRHGEILR